MLKSTRLASSSSARQSPAALPAPSQEQSAVVVTGHHRDDPENSTSGSSDHPTPEHGPGLAPSTRDRRAFSFPAEPASPQIIRQQRQSQTTLPPFIRKPNVVSKNTVSSPVHSASHPKVAKSSHTSTPNPNPNPNGARLQPPKHRSGQSNSAGGNTSIHPESVFSSTSESDDERNKPESPFKVSPFPMPITLSNQPTSLALSPQPPSASGKAPKLHSHKSFKGEGKLTPASFNNAEQRAHDTLRLPQRDGPSIPGRSATHSPVANLVASSASSRSREDIISWAKAVGARPDDASSSDEEHAKRGNRGRSRTRRSPRSRTTGRKFSLHEEAEEGEPDTSRAGTTPKSSIGSALAGLSIGGFGVGPIVKALSTITTSASASASNARTTAPTVVRRLSVVKATGSGSQSALGLQALPSPAEVNRVAVLTSSSMAASSQPPPSTSSTTNPTDSDVPPTFGGATPTLSTISISELVDPSVADHPDHVEVVTDMTDDAMSTASFARRPSSTASRSAAKAAHGGAKTGATITAQGKKPTRPTKKPPLSLRPLVGTGSAIWNISTYLRSITPFSISSAIAPLGPLSPKEEIHPAAAPTSHHSPSKKSQQPLRSAQLSAVAVAPVPTSRVASPDHSEMPPLQIVRSLPMDIALPLKPGAMAAVEERLREREAREWFNRSHSRRRPRSGSRSATGHGQGHGHGHGHGSRARSRSRSVSRHCSHSHSRARSPLPQMPSREKSIARISEHERSRSRPEHLLDDIGMEMDMSDGDRPRGRTEGRRVSYDADESGMEDAPRRGRSRKGKALGAEAEVVAVAVAV